MFDTSKIKTKRYLRGWFEYFEILPYYFPCKYFQRNFKSSPNQYV